MKRPQIINLCLEDISDSHAEIEGYLCDLEGRIAALEDLAQMIIEGESATEDLRTFMYHMWLHKAKSLLLKGG